MNQSFLDQNHSITLRKKTKGKELLRKLSMNNKTLTPERFSQRETKNLDLSFQLWNHGMWLGDNEEGSVHIPIYKIVAMGKWRSWIRKPASIGRSICKLCKEEASIHFLYKIMRSLDRALYLIPKKNWSEPKFFNVHSLDKRLMSSCRAQVDYQLW